MMHAAGSGHQPVGDRGRNPKGPAMVIKPIRLRGFLHTEL